MDHAGGEQDSSHLHIWRAFSSTPAKIIGMMANYPDSNRSAQLPRVRPERAENGLYFKWDKKRLRVVKGVLGDFRRPTLCRHFEFTNQHQPPSSHFL